MPPTDSSLTRNNHFDCFGDWWECQQISNCEVKMSPDSSRAHQSISNKSDRSNLGNGELSQELESPPTYFIELREEADMKQVEQHSLT